MMGGTCPVLGWFKVNKSGSFRKKTVGRKRISTLFYHSKINN
jgi:hypothetical protein